ncbi:dTDP-4-dehydrorhamnose reductase [Dyella sp. C9]|uniref:dTDP-4-dehydrorhamnose reductase n=1 Tax=Dyella sp. C9 TaxID=2202154 RepID=UPI000DEFBC10|nr:dTDP-4-dehydrorhamnose reductase [Dyella sp. C9]
MTMLVLGAGGQLGRSFLAHSSLAALDHVVAATRDGQLDGRRVETVDMADGASLRAVLDRVSPSLIINAAAYTAVDRAESEESLAARINGEAPGIIGDWAARHDALVVHFSTDYVFDGALTRPYRVDDAPNPISAYGRSKLAGERALAATGAPHFIFRTAWVYAAQGNNFLRSMLRLAEERTELRIVNDQFGSPTCTSLLVEATLAAIDRWRRTPVPGRGELEGTYHVVSSGITTWHDFATLIFQKARATGLLKTVPTVIPIGTGDYPAAARRPAWSVLDNTTFCQRFDFAMPDWRDGLEETINKLYAEANRSC